MLLREFVTRVTFVALAVTAVQASAHILPLNRYEIWLREPETIKSEIFEEIENYKISLARQANREAKNFVSLGVDIIEAGWRYRSEGNLFVPYIVFETTNSEVLERIKLHYGEDRAFRFYSVSNFPEPVILYDTSYLKHIHFKDKIDFTLILSSYADLKKILNKIKRLKNVESAEVILSKNEKAIRVKIANEIFAVSDFLIKISKIREVQKYDIGPQRSIIFEDTHSLSKYFNLTLKKEGSLQKMLPEILGLGVLIHFVVRDYNIVSIELRGPKEYIEERLDQLRRLESIRAIESTLSPRNGFMRGGGDSEGGTPEDGGSSAAYCVQIF